MLTGQNTLVNLLFFPPIRVVTDRRYLMERLILRLWFAAMEFGKVLDKRHSLQKYIHYGKCFNRLYNVLHKNNIYPGSIYLLEVNNRNTRTRWEICSKLTIKIPERRQWWNSGVFNVNFEHILQLILVFLLSILLNFEHVNASWDQLKSNKVVQLPSQSKFNINHKINPSKAVSVVFKFKSNISLSHYRTKVIL